MDVLNERFKEVRESLNLKQNEFAKHLGMTPSYISSIEKGRKEVTIKIIKLLIEHFQVNPSWLLSGESENIFTNRNVKRPPKKSFGDPLNENDKIDKLKSQREVESQRSIKEGDTGNRGSKLGNGDNEGIEDNDPINEDALIGENSMFKRIPDYKGPGTSNKHGREVTISELMGFWAMMETKSDLQEAWHYGGKLSKIAGRLRLMMLHEYQDVIGELMVNYQKKYKNKRDQSGFFIENKKVLDRLLSMKPMFKSAIRDFKPLFDEMRKNDERDILSIFFPDDHYLGNF